jgi:hypothetical protein
MVCTMLIFLTHPQHGGMELAAVVPLLGQLTFKFRAHVCGGCGMWLLWLVVAVCCVRGCAWVACCMLLRVVRVHVRLGARARAQRNNNSRLGQFANLNLGSLISDLSAPLYALYLGRFFRSLISSNQSSSLLKWAYDT